MVSTQQLSVAQLELPESDPVSPRVQANCRSVVGQLSTFTTKWMNVSFLTKIPETEMLDDGHWTVQYGPVWGSGGALQKVDEGQLQTQHPET